jgi:hypothetical protein
MKNPNFESCTLILKLNPFKPSTIAFFSNSHTLVILLQIDPASGDELETVCEGCYEIENTWFLVLDVDIIIGCTVQFVDCLLIARQIT